MSDDELELLALARLMNGRHGRTFMWLYLTQCGIFNSGFNENSNRMAYLNGRRDSARVMNDELKRANKRLYLLMIEENDNGG